MPLYTLKKSEKEHLLELFFQLKGLAGRFPSAGEEIMTGLRCLKAIHSNSIEDKSIDRIFLQIILHGAGVPDKSKISPAYDNAARELRGQDKMLQGLEIAAHGGTPLTISMVLQMHGRIFRETWPDVAGKFRQEEVSISGMSHHPPHASQVPMLLHQNFETINARLKDLGPVSPKSFFDILHTSAQAHYLIAHVHPFRDGNGRIARAVGDYVMLSKGLFYDVIMTDYRDAYLDALEESDLTDCTALFNFLLYSYLETLQRISTFFRLVVKDASRPMPAQSDQ